MYNKIVSMRKITISIITILLYYYLINLLFKGLNNYIIIYLSAMFITSIFAYLNNLIKDIKFEVNLKSISYSVLFGILLFAINFIFVKNKVVLKSNIDIIIAIIIIIPISEELLYRVILYNSLRCSLNEKISIILQALLFSFMHLNIYSFISAILLQLIYNKTNNLFIVTATHLMNNLLFFIYHMS